MVYLVDPRTVIDGRCFPACQWVCSIYCGGKPLYGIDP